MEKNKRIKKEENRLKKIYKNIEDNKKETVIGLIQRVAYLRVTLEDFEKDLFPDMKSAVVLTEDGIYDMMTASSGTAIHMLELATKILKR